MIEGASYTLSVTPDPKLDAYVDGLIAKIAAAQEPDGYLYTTRTINPKKPHRWAGPGALGARARRQPRALQPRPPVRGRRRAPPGHRQDARCSTSRSRPPTCSCKTFGPGKRSTWPGHQITEMALVQLYRVTGKEEYLTWRSSCSTSAVPGRCRRGERANPRGLDYNQAQLKVVEQTRAGRPRGARDVHVFGHGRRRRAHRRRRRSATPATRIWDNLSTSKLYLTGGIGASGGGEAFGQPLRAAEHDGLQRDLRVGRHGLLEPPPVPARTATRSTST